MKFQASNRIKLDINNTQQPNSNNVQGLIVNHWSTIFDMELERTYVVDFDIFGEKAQNPLDPEVDFFRCKKRIKWGS